MEQERTFRFREAWEPEPVKFCNNKITTTKYTLITFLPKNLFEQFSRIANFYFLIMIFLMQLPWAQMSRVVSAIPLTLVVSISAIREAIEDILRRRSDRKINNSNANVFIDDRFVEKRWWELRVGDIVRVSQNDQIPADMVILATAGRDGMAYVETANLDGETNLKARTAFRGTAGMTEDREWSSLRGTVTCEAPNNRVASFEGVLNIDNQRCPVTNEQVLLRGCVLRDTEWVVGIVVFTGRESKVMMNASSARMKRSKLERGLNLKLVSVFVCLFVGVFDSRFAIGLHV